MQKFFITIAIITLILAIKKVWDKKTKDYKPSYGVEQISPEEFDEQKRQNTLNEVLALKASKEYQYM